MPAAAVRRRLVIDAIGIALSAFAFAVVYGLAAREAGFSIAEGMAMSLLVFAGAAQFAAVGLITQGVPWFGIVVLTAFLNTRHLLYSAALAPWFSGTSRVVRAVAAHVLTDEAFALTMPAFRLLGRFDLGSYAIAAGFTMVPWVTGTVVGFLGGQLLPDPEVLALDVVFPAAMAGLTVALVVDRRTLVAALLGGVLALVAALVVQPSVGVIVGGVAAPVVAMLIRQPRAAAATDATEAAP
jgi:4-azaleucine resistance transporter AzlC